MVPVSVDGDMMETNTTNMTKLVVEYLEEREIRSLKYGDGINVLGEEIALLLRDWSIFFPCPYGSENLI